MSLRPILSPERIAIIEHAVDAGAAIDQLARLLSPDAAAQALRAASRKLDIAVSKGVIHKNQAANKKSAMARHFNAL